MDQQIKNSFYSMYQVHNDDNMIKIIYLSSLIDTTSDSKEFSLGGSDIDCIIECLNDRIIRNMDMSN